MANTTNAGTRLIKGRCSFAGIRAIRKRALDLFYMAGEIIRELRKAHENKQVSVPATKDDMRKAA